MLHLFTEEVRRNPYPLYATMPPIVQANGMCALFDYDSVKRVLTDHEAFISAVGPPGGKGPLEWLIFFDPPRHTRLRALISRASPRERWPRWSRAFGSSPETLSRAGSPTWRWTTPSRFR